MSNAIARWLYQSRVGMLVASGSVVAASTTAGIVLSGHVNHTGVLGEKFTNPSSGAGSGGSGPTTTNGTTGSVPASSAFTVTARASGTISPGQSQTLNVTVHNPNTQDMQITGASGVVNSVSKPGCLASWFTVEDWAPGTAPTIAPAKGTAVIQMRLDFVDTTTNQDACKSAAGSPVRIGFTLHATGAQA